MESSKVAYFRNFVFGVEDSLVSTVGLLSGIAIAGMGTKEILLTGFVLIFVEAVSMAAGSFLSESSAEEFSTQKDATSARSYVASFVMLISYVVSGFVPLAPYAFLAPAAAFPVSVGLSLVALLLLGALSGALSRTHFVKSALRMMLIGGLAIGVGIGVGNFAS